LQLHWLSPTPGHWSGVGGVALHPDALDLRIGLDGERHLIEARMPLLLDVGGALLLPEINSGVVTVSTNGDAPYWTAVPARSASTVEQRFAK
jgi:hypothetical protein